LRGRTAPRRAGGSACKVYPRCMSRTNIDLDDNACRVVMERYHLSTKREAVNFALRTVAAEPLGLDQARRLRGSGWDGDLDQMRASRVG
jgi:Arc/MetJ family transcription regulator